MIAKDPKIVFLMETKVDKLFWKELVEGSSLLISLLFLVSIQGAALLYIGSLILEWMFGLFSDRHIDALINQGVDDS